MVNRTCCYKYPRARTHLDVPVGEEILDQVPVYSVHACVMNGKTVGQEAAEVVVLHLFGLCPEHLS